MHAFTGDRSAFNNVLEILWRISNTHETSDGLSSYSMRVYAAETEDLYIGTYNEEIPLVAKKRQAGVPKTSAPAGWLCVVACDSRNGKPGSGAHSSSKHFLPSPCQILLSCS
jgi:hypothetical protein